MLSPEVSDFSVAHSQFRIDKLDDKVPKSVTNFYYNHHVTLFVADNLKIPKAVIEQLVANSDYYKVSRLNLKDLIDRKFLASFIRSGKLTLLSINTRIDCDNCIAITPAGVLILTVDRETYNSLGLEGNVSHHLAKTKDRYVIRVDLSDEKLLEEQKKLTKLREKLSRAGVFDVIFVWEPPKLTICPTSAAKYFADCGYSVSEYLPSYASSTKCSLMVPQLHVDDDNEVVNFVEWLGMVAIEGDTANQHPDGYVSSYVASEPDWQYGQVQCCRWTGFFTATNIATFIQKLRSVYETELKPWIAVYVQGFSDSPVAWSSQENNYYTNSDNGYVYILNGENAGVFCTVHTSQKHK